MWQKLLLNLFIIIMLNEYADAQDRFVGSYKFYPGVGYYKFYKFKVNWGEAWSQCREEKAHLVVIDSDRELEVVKKLQSDIGNTDWVYIGVHDLFLNSYYVSVLGKLIKTISELFLKIN